LFNAFYFWEAHEAWEGLWAVKDKSCPARLLLQGLIQIAAALLKVHTRSWAGAVSLSRDGLAKVAEVEQAQPRLLGLDLRRVHQDFTTYFRPLARRTLPALDASVPVLTLLRDPDA
jgi:hypothetical protein